MLEVDLKDVDQMVQPEYTPWITNMEVNIDTTMLVKYIIIYEMKSKEITNIRKRKWQTDRM
jgi:hypothetical protein